MKIYTLRPSGRWERLTPAKRFAHMQTKRVAVPPPYKNSGGLIRALSSSHSLGVSEDVSTPRTRRLLAALSDTANSLSKDLTAPARRADSAPPLRVSPPYKKVERFFHPMLHTFKAHKGNYVK